MEVCHCIAITNCYALWVLKCSQLLFLTRAPLGGLFRDPLAFSCDIFETNAGITNSLPNLQYPLSHHFYTLC